MRAPPRVCGDSARVALVARGPCCADAGHLHARACATPLLPDGEPRLGTPQCAPQGTAGTLVRAGVSWAAATEELSHQWDQAGGAGATMGLGQWSSRLRGQAWHWTLPCCSPVVHPLARRQGCVAVARRGWMTPTRAVECSATYASALAPRHGTPLPAPAPTSWPWQPPTESWTAASSATPTSGCAPVPRTLETRAGCPPQRQLEPELEPRRGSQLTSVAVAHAVTPAAVPVVAGLHDRWWRGALGTAVRRHRPHRCGVPPKRGPASDATPPCLRLGLRCCLHRRRRAHRACSRATPGPPRRCSTHGPTHSCWMVLRATLSSPPQQRE